jgi:serine/threonine protein kinase
VLLELGPGEVPVRACLADFGTSKLSAATMSETQTGTLAFMPPEVVMGSSHDAYLADIYSLGLVVYETLAGIPVESAPRHPDETGSAPILPPERVEELLGDEIASIVAFIRSETPRSLLEACTDRRPTIRPTIEKLVQFVFPAEL